MPIGELAASHGLSLSLVLARYPKPVRCYRSEILRPEAELFDHLKRQLGFNVQKRSVAIRAELQGAYRLHRPDDAFRFTSLARDAFPHIASRITCFGADWAGNQFASDASRLADGQPLVLLLEPGTGKALEIPATYKSFHEEQLLENADAVVGLSFYQKWLSSGGLAPKYNECIGYKNPLYLGGPDEITNLELSDFDVYWTICAQLLSRTHGLPFGTKIHGVSIGD